MNVALIYPNVLVALLPAAAAAVYYYGIRALLILLTAMLFTSAGEFVFIRYIRKQRFVWDASALVSGAVFALILPPTVPLWLVILGALFASVVVRQCFGGLGCNLFNPALAACAFLSLAFPSYMSVYESPLTSRWSVSSLFAGAADAVSSATPAAAKTGVLLFDLFSGRYPGAIGETCAIAILLGGAYLLWLGILRYGAPLTYLVLLAAGTWLFEGPSAVPAFLLTGGVLFGAVFSMGDYTTTPISGSGRVIFGAGAAVLTLIMRQFGNTSYAVGFSILVMNTLTPILDFYIRPRVFSMPNWFSKKGGDQKTIGKEPEIP
jgi:electron transport complex protein RnfD